MTNWIELFVPGRVCLFGEHSDWAGGHRRTNSKLVPGVVMIAGTNQGMYARIRKSKGELSVRSTLPDGSRTEVYRVPMDAETLRREAAAGGFFSYAAGVAAYMLEFYGVDGIEIDNYKTDLPVKKGLSSSAAFCVLVARAFNRIYNLALTTRAEIEAAYQGEISTPSRCGRMDQGCAFGQIPVMMFFDGDRLDVKPVRPGCDFHFLIADLCGQKDTVRILGDLNSAFPFAKTEQDRKVQDCLGIHNREILAKAKEAVERGDPQLLGALMDDAQRIFDGSLMAISEQLKSPKLHEVLADDAIAKWIFGGKGVGSQGDGCVQFVCRSRKARSDLADYLTSVRGMPCFELDILKPVSIRKAVIPVAGLGTRMYPYTKAVPKTFLPVVSPDGIVKPVIQMIIEEALSAGVEEVCLIVQPEDEARFRSYFQTPDRSDVLGKLPSNIREAAEAVIRVGQKLTFIPQHEAKGFGHAVLLAREWVGDEPFLLMLGDQIFSAGTGEKSVARQITDIFEQFGDAQSVVGIYEEQLERVCHYGALTGEWLNETVLQLSRIEEKPDIDFAQTYLKTRHNGNEKFFCVNGIYALKPSIFGIIEKDAGAGEIQLTAALEKLREVEGVKGVTVKGVHFDTGLPQIYRETVMRYGEKL